jgi:hypothetical protein
VFPHGSVALIHIYLIAINSNYLLRKILLNFMGACLIVTKDDSLAPPTIEKTEIG